MKRVVFFIFMLYFVIDSFSQNINPTPWGIWDCESVEADSPIMDLSSGRYYYSQLTLSWIGISKDSEGLIAGNYDFPIFAVDGTFVRIEKFEKIRDGFVLHLVGNGIKHDNGKPKFKDNVQIKLKMVFISADECVFQYYSKTDSEGFRLTFSAKENCVYRRNRVSSE